MSPSQGCSATGRRSFLSKLFIPKKGRGHYHHHASVGTSRESFALLLKDPQMYADFRQMLSIHEESAPLFLFRDGYLRLQSFLSAIAAGVDVKNAKFSQATANDVRKSLSAVQNEEEELLDVPEWLCTLIDRFYRTFILPGAVEQIVGLSDATRKVVGENLRSLDQCKLPRTVFDSAAREVYDLLYDQWFPVFLKERKKKYGELGRKSTSYEREDFDLLSSPVKKSGFSWLGFGKRRSSVAGELVGSPTALSPDEVADEPEVAFTRDGFLRVLCHPGLYAKLVDCAKETLCLENIMFYEAYAKLEAQIYAALERDGETTTSVEKVELTRCLVRFIDPGGASLIRGSFSDTIFAKTESLSTLSTPISSSNPEAVLSQDTLSTKSSPSTLPAQQYTVPNIPASVMPHVLLFYSTFIMPGAHHEVNLTHAIRKSIIERLSTRDERGVPAGLHTLSSEPIASADTSSEILPSSVKKDTGIPVTLFDEAVDEILDLLYRNTFFLLLRGMGGRKSIGAHATPDSAAARRLDSGKGDLNLHHSR
ncbi:hypothetical protein HDU85_000176 [Gaertneriomyces sp. JEL0708]|nr:hypothetical protein HDU85_000176 [Gaertneriomyces sp. JEL0708]